MEGRLQWARRLGVWSVVSVLLIMVLGAWVKANGAGLACPDWPACYGRYLPPFPSADSGGTYEGEPVPYTHAQVLYEWVHRAVVSLAIIPVAAFALVTATSRSFGAPLRVIPSVALGLFLFQALVGALTVFTGNPPWATTWHLLNATLILVALVVAASHAYFVVPRPSVAKRTYRFTPSVHARGKGFTYPAEADVPAAPPGRFPGEATEERHG